jgi:GNAT superfamily N-acetyltransferase
MNADKIVIRPMQGEDIHGAMRLKAAENWNQTEDDWRTLLKLDPHLCLAATSDSKLVGTVTATNYTNELAWVGMMLVDKDFRGMGLGKRLLTTLLEKLGAFQSIKLDATATGLPLYNSLGFSEELSIDRMVTTHLEESLRSEAHHAVKPLSPARWLDVMDLDRAFFGVDRSRLMAEILLINKGWYVEREGRMTGYLLVRLGSNYTQLGPLSAETAEDAEMLLRSVLPYFSEKPVLLDILQDKIDLKEFLLSCGFNVQRSFTRMFLKGNSFAGSVQNQFLIAGPELG